MKKQPVSQHQDYFQFHECHLSAEKNTAHEIQCGRLRKFWVDITTASVDDIRAQNMFRSYAALCSEKYRQYKYFPLSIHPFSKLRIYLEGIFVASILVSNTFLTIHFTQPNPENKVPHILMMYTVDSIYISNIIINFFTGYVTGDTCQHVVLDLRKICFRYTTTWLIPDILSGFRFLPISPIDTRIVPELLLISMQLLRVPIFVVYLHNILKVLRAGIYKRTIIQIIVIIYYYLTWNIFLQFAVEYMHEGSYLPENPSNCSWITIAKLWNAPHEIRLVYALNRAVGMFRKSTNINLVSKNGCFENFIVVSWIISKLLVYHCVLTYIVALLGTESAKAKYYIMTRQVETYMDQRRFPPRIKQKIMKFYAIRYQSNYFVDSKMLACLSGQLREDIIMHTSRQLVEELAFLKQLPRPLLLQIGLNLRLVIFIAGDIIFKINTIGDCLYFIDKGTVAIYSESGNEICHLEDGDFFGEIALVMKRPFRTASVVAVTNCELFRLDKEEFDNSIACYPTVYETIQKVAINRFEKTCVLDEHHKIMLRTSRDLNFNKRRYSE